MRACHHQTYNFGSDHTLRLAQMLFDKIDATMEELRREEAARNRARFLRMRAEGKTYWLVDQGKLSTTPYFLAHGAGGGRAPGRGVDHGPRTRPSAAPPVHRRRVPV